MPKTPSPLTNTQVQNAKPRDKEYNLADGNGLYLRVKPNGTKLWLLNYRRPYTTSRTHISLGSYPAVSLAEARNKTQKMKTLLANNIDPKTHQEEKAREQHETLQNTLSALSGRWITLKRTKVSQNYADDIERSLELHIMPALGEVPVAQLRAAQVITLLKRLEAKGSLETIKRLCQRLNEIMGYAVNTGVLEVNPLSGIRQAFKTPTPQNMPTIKRDQLPNFMQTLSRASIKLTTRYLIEWQLHTITRPGEAARARWEEISLAEDIWRIRPETMKMKREHVVPLTAQTKTILEAMKPLSGHCEYIFPADRDPSRHIHPQTANGALKRMGYQGVLVAHGLRSLASTVLNEQDFNSDVIEAALAHVDSNSVRRAYNRSDYLEQRKPLMTWWSNFIVQAAEGNLSLSASTAHYRS